MTSLRHRPPDPTAWTWEPAAVLAGCWLLGTAYSPAVAVAVIGWARGLGWSWPSAPFDLAGQVLTGDAGGVAAAAGAHAAGLLALVALEQGLLLVTVVLVVRRWWSTWTGRARQGFADVRTCRTILGVQRLRSVRRQIRPDLWGRSRRVSGGTGRPTGSSRLLSGAEAALTSKSRLVQRVRRHRVGFDPGQVGWRLGRAEIPRGGGRLWVPFDRTVGVVGPQGSGKTLDLLVPALLAAPGAALVTLTKTQDLQLSIRTRSRDGRPVVVLDPYGMAPGLPQLVWDPIAGCQDPLLAERRAKAFTAGTIKAAAGAGSGAGTGDDAARFYAHEAAKVLQAYLHAAALSGADLDEVLGWVADPHAHPQAEEVLRTHPDAAPFWDGLLRGAIHGDDRTAANTIATVQQALALFFQASIRHRCTPTPARPATDIREVIRNGGTVYLLGREDPYSSASPLMTAVAEDVLDTALQLANASVHGRLCPPLLAVLDELPSTTPLPTLATRMANERAIGLSFVYATQTWRQLVMVFGEQTARSLYTLTNNLVVFGGSKDAAWNKELSDLIGTERVVRRTRTHGWSTGSTSTSTEDTPVIRAEEIRELPTRHALVIPENARPVVARLTRCIEGRMGRRLLAQQAALRSVATAGPVPPVDTSDATTARQSTSGGATTAASVTTSAARETRSEPIW